MTTSHVTLPFSLPVPSGFLLCVPPLGARPLGKGPRAGFSFMHTVPPQTGIRYCIVHIRFLTSPPLFWDFLLSAHSTPSS